MANKTAMVLGATGRVGVPLCRELIADGWDVHGVARCTDAEMSEKLRDEGVMLQRFDVVEDDPRGLPDVQVVFLEIWDPTRPELIWPINFYGVGRVVERYQGMADIVNGCTINVYGSSPDASSEDFPPRPDSEYGRSRYAQEKLIDYFCDRGGRRGIHIRYAHSNSASNGLVYRTARSVLAGESLGSHPDQRLRVIAIEDFVRVTHLAVERVANPPVVVNCTDPAVWTLRQLAEELQRRLGSGKVVFDRENGGVEHSVYADPSRMIEWFGAPRVSMETLLGRVVNHLNQNRRE